MITAGLYDLIVLALVAVFAWRGYQKGLVNQVGALITVLVIGSISVAFAPNLSSFMPGSGNLSFAIAFIIIVLLASLVIWNIVNALSKLITKFKLKSWNKQMGAFLGFINGIFVAMIVTFCLLVFVVPREVQREDGTYTQTTYDREHSFITNSLFGPYLKSATLTTIKHLPYGRTKFYNNIREKLQEHANNYSEQNPDSIQTNNTTPSGNYDNRPYEPQERFEQTGYNRERQRYRDESQQQTPYGYGQTAPSGYDQSAPSRYRPSSPSGYGQPVPSGYNQPTPSGYDGSTAPANPNPVYNGNNPYEGIF